MTTESKDWFEYDSWQGEGPCEISASDIVDIIVSQTCAFPGCALPADGIRLDRSSAFTSLLFVCDVHRTFTRD